MANIKSYIYDENTDTAVLFEYFLGGAVFKLIYCNTDVYSERIAFSSKSSNYINKILDCLDKHNLSCTSYNNVVNIVNKLYYEENDEQKQKRISEAIDVLQKNSKKAFEDFYNQLKEQESYTVKIEDLSAEAQQELKDTAAPSPQEEFMASSTNTSNVIAENTIDGGTLDEVVVITSKTTSNTGNGTTLGEVIITGSKTQNNVAPQYNYATSYTNSVALAVNQISYSLNYVTELQSKVTSFLAGELTYSAKCAIELIKPINQYEVKKRATYLFTYRSKFPPYSERAITEELSTDVEDLEDAAKQQALEQELADAEQELQDKQNNLTAKNKEKINKAQKKINKLLGERPMPSVDIPTSNNIVNGINQIFQDVHDSIHESWGKAIDEHNLKKEQKIQKRADDDANKMLVKTYKTKKSIIKKTLDTKEKLTKKAKTKAKLVKTQAKIKLMALLGG